jgi:hypothetical protein
MRLARRLALLAALGSVSAAAVAEVMILRSVGPSAQRYKAGQRLPDNVTLVLRPGDSVSVLKATGTRVFRGPGSFSVSAPPQTAQATPPNGHRRGTGVVRGTGEAERLRFDNLWQFDAGISGTACFRKGAPLQLWRAATDKPLSLSLSPGSGSPVSIEWKAGQQLLTLEPKHLREDGRIEFQQPGATRPTRIALKEVQADPADRVALAAALLAKECRDQTDTFIALNEERAK